MTNFFEKKDKERLEFYEENYYDKQMSWRQIATLIETNANRVRRDANKLGVISRDKSQAQKTALSTGRSKHPTEGTVRSDETKLRISESQGKVWDNLSEEQMEFRRRLGEEAWNKKSEDEKAEFFKKRAEAVYKASQDGSKAENYLFDYLNKEGYKVLRQSEHLLHNEKFHIDLYLPDNAIAIEVDGPMHHEPVYGEDRLKKRQAADNQKNGLILSMGNCLLRVKLERKSSDRYLRTLASQVLEVIQKIEKKFPSKNERYFIL